MFGVEVSFSVSPGYIPVWFSWNELPEQKFFENAARVVLGKKADQMFFQVPKGEVLVDLVAVFPFLRTQVNFGLAALGQQRLEVEQQNGGMKTHWP